MACPPPQVDWATWSCLREDIAPIATFVGAAIVALAALAQARTARRRHQEQTAADRERRITESFAKAVEQLGSDKLETRLGAIYTLERISRESEREYWPIMETLTAYVREHAPWPPRQALANPSVQLQVSGGDERDSESTPVKEPKAATEQTTAQIRPATDIQAILTVLGRRDEQARKQDGAAGRRLDLAATDLRGANLWDAHLQGARLPGAVGLTQEQLDMAFGNDRTLLPDGLTRPARWPAVTSDKPDNSR